jgi:hypothetical protein
MNPSEKPLVSGSKSPVRPNPSMALDQMLAELESHRSSVGTSAKKARAVALGVAVAICGALVMGTAISLVAITALLMRGEPPETIVATLPHSFALALFNVTGALVANLAAGYVAAIKAAAAHMRVAFAAGFLAALLNLALLAVWGDNNPLWFTLSTTALGVPFATLGGWLAMPVRIVRDDAGRL